MKLYFNPRVNPKHSSVTITAEVDCREEVTVKLIDNMDEADQILKNRIAGRLFQWLKENGYL